MVQPECVDANPPSWKDTRVKRRVGWSIVACVVIGGGILGVAKFVDAHSGDDSITATVIAGESNTSSPEGDHPSSRTRTRIPSSDSLASRTSRPTTSSPDNEDTPHKSSTTKSSTKKSTPLPPTGSVGAEVTKDVKVTFYGTWDNDPKGTKEISNPVLHDEVGGTGTYDDPLTFASPEGKGAYPIGTIIYVDWVQKYYIREDTCAVSWTAPNGCGAVDMVDLFVGNPSDSEAVTTCEDALTPDKKIRIIINPSKDLPVDETPIWDQATGKCMTPHQG